MRSGCMDASLGRPVDEVVSWWNEAVAEDQPLSEGQPAIVKVEPGPRYFEVTAAASVWRRCGASFTATGPRCA